MKILLCSDLQSYDWPSYSETDSRGINLRLLDTVRELKRLHDLCLKNGVGMFAVLGDIFEARSQLSVSVLNAVYESFYSFHESGIKVVLLVGNHDRTSIGNDHALKVFKSFATVIDRPMTIPIEGGNLVGIPFHPKDETIRQALKKYVNKNTSLLVMHCAVKSVRLPGGKVWGQGISLEDIPTYTTALLGHYHRWTELRPGKVWYLGSLGPVDFGDVSVDKFYAVYNTANKQVSFHHSRFPQFITLDLSLKEGFFPPQGVSLTPSSLDIEKYLGVLSGNFLKVKRVPQGYTDFSGLHVVLTSLGARHVSFDMDTVASAGSVNQAAGEDVSREWASMAVVEMLEQYVETTPHNLEPERLIETGQTIVEALQAGAPGEIDLSEEELLDALAEEESHILNPPPFDEEPEESETLDSFLLRTQTQKDGEVENK